MVYSIMQDCWHHDPMDRPSFRQLRFRLKETQSTLATQAALSEQEIRLQQRLEAAARQADAQQVHIEVRTIPSPCTLFLSLAFCIPCVFLSGTHKEQGAGKPKGKGVEEQEAWGHP